MRGQNEYPADNIAFAEFNQQDSLTNMFADVYIECFSLFLCLFGKYYNEIVAILEFRCNIAMVYFEEHSIKKLLIEHYNL